MRGLCLVNAYRRRKLEGAGIIVSCGLATNGVALGCGPAIAWICNAWRAVAYADAAMARGYSLRETAVRARLANWTDISDVALLKRLCSSEEWLRFLCVELLQENFAYQFAGVTSLTIRIVDGTIVREPGKTGSQWRILCSIRVPSLVCDVFEVTATIGEGSGESLNRLPVGPHDPVLADACYCSVAGTEYLAT